jgi:uncharacterized protein
MKKTRWLIVCTVAVLVLIMGVAVGCAPGSGQQVISLSPQQSTGIWVSGHGEVTVVPDMANLTLGIEVGADTVEEAQLEASESMDAVRQALQDSGVAEKDIQTQRYSVYPITNWTENRGEEITGYRVTNMVTAKIREVDNAGAVIDTVVRAGGDNIRIQGISFTVDDPEPYYEEARAKAVEDAANKAEHIASLASVNLGQPTYISEGNTYMPSDIRYMYDEVLIKSSSPETYVSPGELDISIDVQIAYAIK